MPCPHVVEPRKTVNQAARRLAINGDGRWDGTGTDAAEPQEDAHGYPGSALVAVDQCVIAATECGNAAAFSCRASRIPEETSETTPGAAHSSRSRRSEGSQGLIRLIEPLPGGKQAGQPTEATEPRSAGEPRASNERHGRQPVPPARGRPSRRISCRSGLRPAHSRGQASRPTARPVSERTDDQAVTFPYRKVRVPLSVRRRRLLRVAGATAAAAATGAFIGASPARAAAPPPRAGTGGALDVDRLLYTFRVPAQRRLLTPWGRSRPPGRPERRCGAAICGPVPAHGGDATTGTPPSGPSRSRVGRR